MAENLISRMPLGKLWTRIASPNVLPIGLLLTLSFGCLFGLLFKLTTIQDRMEEEREVELIQHAVVTQTNVVDHDLRDYAVWDEAAENIVARFDRKWAEQNLGPYLVGAQGYESVFVLDERLRPVYVYGALARVHPFDLRKAYGQALSRAAADTIRDGKRRDPLVAGFSATSNGVFKFAVSRIQPLSDRIKLGQAKPRIIGIARRIDASFAERILEGDRHLTVTTLPAIPPDQMSVPLRSVSGSTVGHVVWLPSRPGSALRAAILPAFLLIGLICVLVAALIVRSGRRAIEAIRFSENRANHLATHDALTGMPNRRAMYGDLEALVESRGQAWLLYMDLDGFKETNDVYGHGAGDSLLKAVAHRLRESIRPHSLARVGGDEFAAIVIGEQIRAVTVAEAILKTFGSAFSVGQFKVSLGVSIGIANTSSCADVDEIVRRADSAMYAAKAAGKQCMSFYDPVLDAGREMRKRLETDLRDAIRNGEIKLVYQGIVGARSRAVVAVEALARWDHPELGVISPDQFIPIAESSGSIVELGRFILETACRDTLGWPVDLAVNLSPAQFWDRALAKTVMDVLMETGFPPSRLELEITEGYLFRRPEAAARVLAQLRAIGLRISLDDFGTGFASIGSLRQLNIDAIKIDRSFVAAAANDSRSAELVRAVIDVGRALDMPVTAEGVETPRQALDLQRSGCARLQGWHFCIPMSAVEFTGWLAERERASA